MEELVYFELNDWDDDETPDTPIMKDWLGDYYDENDNYVPESIFANEKYVKDNNLCVKQYDYDMSFCYMVIAPKKWLEEQCPELLITRYIISRSEDGKYHSQYDKNRVFDEYIPGHYEFER